MSATAPRLFAAATTVRVLAQARAAVFLIGSYDGSGNYGDIAQFGAALALVERLSPGVLAFPVLEREYLGSHLELAERSGVSAPRAVYFDSAGNHEDDLLPVAAPTELAFSAVYLYGGGYLNRNWGARKLAMLAAAEGLLAASGSATSIRLATGLQVDAGWIDSDAASPLRQFDLLGSRDGASGGALRALDAAAAVETGDDAIGLLGRLPSGHGRTTNGEHLQLNLHFAEHDWVSERAGKMLDFYAGFLGQLGTLSGRPVAVQPLIAYLDRRIDERAALARLATTLTPLGIELSEPIVLRPAELSATAPQLGRADLTLSCSYHVALTSLMLQVPAFLIGDNPYYEQKAAGLREDFGLPAGFTATTSADPVVAASNVGAALLDPTRREELRSGLAAAAERLGRRRGEAEAELLGQLGAAAAAALGDRLDEQGERLRQRASEPAELQHQLATTLAELEELQATTAEPRLEAELRVLAARDGAAETQAALDRILQSRSWRLLAPLRRLRALLRRH